jgi:hypothetical protein
MSLTLAIVTASTNLERAAPCLKSWRKDDEVPLIIVLQTDQDDWRTVVTATHVVSRDYLGTVPAFRLGVDYALRETDADIIACLHDDVELLQPDWIQRTIRHFELTENCGLLGFGGAIGLGADDIYKKPYDPMQLARIGFRSNLVDAEVHGLRSLLAEPVACLDGFSQVGRRAFFEGDASPHTPSSQDYERPWSYLEDHGIVHHLYDGLLGALAARQGWEAWYLPIRCRHLGGQTAVGERGYSEWAKQQIPEGDHGFWQQSHKIGYELFRDQLPLRV